MKGYRPLQRHTVRLPLRCAWCGGEVDDRTRTAHLVHNVLWLQTRILATLPICARCDAYVQALHRAEQRLLWGLMALGGPASALLLWWWGGPVDGIRNWLGFITGTIVLGLFLAWASRWVLVRTGLAAPILRRLAGEPPPDYAGHATVPGEFVAGQHIRFYSAAFHHEFAELNPRLAPDDWVEPGQRETLPS